MSGSWCGYPLVPVSELYNLIQTAEYEGLSRVVLLRHHEREESLIAVYETSLHREIREFLERGQSSVFVF